MATTAELLRVTVDHLRALELPEMLHHGAAVKIMQMQNKTRYDLLTVRHSAKMPPFDRIDKIQNALLLADRQDEITLANNRLEVHFHNVFLLVLNESMDDVALGDIMLYGEDFVPLCPIFRDIVDLRYFMLHTHMTMDYTEDVAQLPYISYILNDISSALTVAVEHPLVFSFYSRSTSELQLREYQARIHSFITRIEAPI
jgi:hypothetical protein